MGVGELADRSRWRARRRRRRRRIVVLQDARKTDVRRRPRRIGLQRRLKRLERFGLVVLLEKQSAPRGFDHRRIAAGALGVAVEGVGVASAVERVRGTPGAEEHRGIR